MYIVIYLYYNCSLILGLFDIVGQYWSHFSFDQSWQRFFDLETDDVLHITKQLILPILLIKIGSSYK